jgi:Putative transposase/Transposase zinc-binding domain
VRPALEAADIFRCHGEAFRAAQGGRLSPDQRRAMAAIEACRTATLGGHVERCDDCGLVRVAYNSCRDRHCPKCQGLARAQWLADRQADLLPVPYFHVVFTVPAPIAALALQNKAVVYDILLKAAADTIRFISADPQHLGAETGMIAILHTWGQTLTHHPHAHCLVPGGGLAEDGRWVSCRPGFFLPVRVLSRLYRRLFLERLRAAFDNAKLQFFGHLAHFVEPAAFTRHLNAVREVEWVVYAKRPFGVPDQVLAYLGRYTHRVAIANSRLLACEQGRVRFRWNDYRADNKPKVMTLDAEEFIRRFLLHVLPKGFRRIRHFGFLANVCRAAKLARIRAALQVPEPPPPPAEPVDYRERTPSSPVTASTCAPSVEATWSRLGLRRVHQHYDARHHAVTRHDGYPQRLRSR